MRVDLFRFREKHTAQTVWTITEGEFSCEMWLVCIGWVISYANEWEDYSNYLGEGAEITRIWATAHSSSVQWLSHA